MSDVDLLFAVGRGVPFGDGLTVAAVEEASEDVEIVASTVDSLKKSSSCPLVLTTVDTRIAGASADVPGSFQKPGFDRPE